MVVITSLSVTSYVQARLYNILRKALSHAVSHLDDRILVMRFENMSSFVLLSLSRRACDSRSFRGRRAELFSTIWPISWPRCCVLPFQVTPGSS